MNAERRKAKSQVIYFILQDALMCLYLQNIVKIFPLVSLETIPTAPHYLIGLMNIAGINIPVIDLALRLGKERYTRYTLEMPILLCQNENHQVGIIVDKVIELSSFRKSELQMADEFSTENSFFLGSVSHGNSSALLLNIKNLLNIQLAANDKLLEQYK